MAKRILVAEDEPLVRAVIVETLKVEGFEVVEAINGRDALEKFLVNPPDLVLLDILMPEKSGLGVCEAIRKMPEPLNKVPIILLTAIDTRSGERTGLEAGADLYLMKPFSLRELRQTVKTLLSE